MAIDWRIRELDEVASTNDEARCAAEQGACEGVVIVAKSQSKGRGRQERVWESPEGNLYLSILLKPYDMPRSAGFYSFVTALAVAETIKHFLPNTDISLKWPNDVLLNGKKISGILIEVIEQTLVVGVGINIAHLPTAPLYPATSMVEQGATMDVKAVRDHFLQVLGKWDEAFRLHGFSPIRTAWLNLAPKGRMTVRLLHESFSGDFINLDGQGHLHLRLENGEERSIATGDVFFNWRGT